jgi:molecular chaperone GrpE (heat shock protein)
MPFLFGMSLGVIISLALYIKILWVEASQQEATTNRHFREYEAKIDKIAGELKASEGSSDHWRNMLWRKQEDNDNLRRQLEQIISG